MAVTLHENTHQARLSGYTTFEVLQVRMHKGLQFEFFGRVLLQQFNYMLGVKIFMRTEVVLATFVPVLFAKS